MSEDAIVHIFNEYNVKIGEVPSKNLTVGPKYQKTTPIWLEMFDLV